MKKIILAASAAFFMMTGLFAQENNAPEVSAAPSAAPEALWKSWSVTASVGAQMYLGENDWKSRGSDMISAPSIDLYVSKWFIPAFGVGLGFTYSPMTGLYNGRYDYANFRTDEFYCTYNEYMPMYRQKTDTFNPYIIAMLDFNNLIGGFKPKRVYHAILYAGGGCIFGKDTSTTRVGGTFNMGLMNTFRVAKYLDLMINLRGGLVSDKFDGESRENESDPERQKLNVPVDGTFGITAGLVFHFGQKKAVPQKNAAK